jgi:hypothetical protein
MSTYFDLQPAVTACRAASAGSRILGFHRRGQTLAALLAGNLFRETRRFRKAGSRRAKIAAQLTMELMKVTRSLRWIFVVISGPSKDQFAVISEDALTQRVRSHISDGKQMLAYSLCFLEIHATANHPVNNHWAITV